VSVPASVRPPERLLCGPGPANVDPRVQEAMGRPILGYLDPDFVRMLDEAAEMLQAVFRRGDGLALPLSSTGTAAMEAGLAALLEPGDTIIVGVAGYFGARLCEIARRLGAALVEVSAPLGKAVPVEALLDAHRAHPDARALAVVHAETSTGVRQPIEELGAALQETETLLVVDCVTSLGGIEVEAEAWGIDYCYSCTQKCLGGVTGMAPVALSPRALERMRGRRSPAPFAFDFELLRRYWVERPPVYHHTVPAPSVYALHEALRLVLEEGLEARWRRHAKAGAALQAGLERLGLEILADEGARLPQLTAVKVPEGADGQAVRARLLAEHGIEVGGGLAGAPPLWRIGLMGANASEEVASRVLGALEGCLG